jgi:hypothetical protein
MFGTDQELTRTVKSLLETYLSIDDIELVNELNNLLEKKSINTDDARQKIAPTTPLLETKLALIRALFALLPKFKEGWGGPPLIGK